MHCSFLLITGNNAELAAGERLFSMKQARLNYTMVLHIYKDRLDGWISIVRMAIFLAL